MTPKSLLSHVAVLAAALVLFAPQALPAGYSWRTVPIGGGGYVTGVVTHPQSANLVYARTDVGGAYRWDEAAGTWIALNDDISQADSQLKGVLSLAVDPNDPNKLYLACGQYLPFWARNAAILRSSDRGATWSRTELSLKLGGNSDGRGMGERLQVDPRKGSILYLGTNQDGLWRSTDSGATWAKITAFPASSINFVLIDPTSGNASTGAAMLYVAVNSTTSSTLYRTIDAGATWTAVANQPSGLMAHQGALDANGTLYLTFTNALGPNSVTAGAVWKLQTSSGTWTNITPPAGQGGFGGLSIDPQKPGTLVVSTLDRWSPADEIYRSTDGGTTWKAILTTGTRDHTSAPWAATSSPHWISDVEIDPFQSNRVWFVTGYGLFATANATAADSGGAVKWSFSNSGLEETVVLGLESPASGAAPLISVTGDVDGFRHTDLNTAPMNRHSPNIGTTVWIAGAGKKPEVLVRTGTSTAQYSTDGGVTWTAFASAPPKADGAGVVAVSADGSRFVWMPTKAGAYFSTNNGSSWTAATGSPSSSSNSYVPVADRSNALKFYIFNQTTGQMFVSLDGGASFSVAATGVPTGSAMLRAAPGNEGHLWLAIWGKGLYRSTDSGTSVSKVSSVADAYKIAFGQAAPGQSYPAVFLWGKVGTVEGFFRSDDVGTTWIRINDDQHQFGWVDAMEGDPRSFGRLYLGAGGRGLLVGEPANTAPTITIQPASRTAAFGSTVSFTVSVSGATSFQWYKNGAAISGSTGSTLTLSNVQAGDAGSYSVVATNAFGSTTSDAATLSLVSGESQKIINISTRSFVSSGSNVQIAGFVIGGTQSKRVLIRAAGPALGAFGLTNYLADPTMTLHDNSQNVLATNDDWSSSDATTLEAAFSSTGAFPWTRGSKDAGLVTTLAPGNYTVHVSGKNGAEGVALIEVYDADENASTAKLINISTRALVKTGSEIMIGGFVVRGTAPKRLLIRAAGPALTAFNVPGVLADPSLKVVDKDANPMASNDDWGNTAELQTAFAATGAFGWAAGSKDAAVVTTLEPGQYTVLVQGANNSTGVALVEVYEYN